MLFFSSPLELCINEVMVNQVSAKPELWLYFRSRFQVRKTLSTYESGAPVCEPGNSHFRRLRNGEVPKLFAWENMRVSFGERVPR
jgi:hypothetical protein